MSMPAARVPKLFLVDGYALIYRAFYALIARPLRTARGENTSAAWGCVNFLLRLQEQHRPDYLVWINDAGDSGRTARYPAYKGTRERLEPDVQADFDQSLVRIEQLLAAMGIPLVAVPGWEADDVIGTLAAQAEGAGVHAVIVSGDKDLYQLIGPHVSLLNPGRGGASAVEEQWVDLANAAERLGVPPHQVIDYLALVGDSSDNVPGVKGIGPKGAVALLAEYGDLETILARAGEVSAKRTRESLLASADDARLSQELVTIKTDVPITFRAEAFRQQPVDQQALVQLLTELEFHSLVRKLSPGLALDPVVAAPTGEPPTGTAAAAPAAPAAMPLPTVLVLDDPSALEAMLAECRAAPLVAFDTETSSLEPHSAQLIGLSLAVRPDRVWYLPFDHRPAGGELAAPAPVVNLPPISSDACAALRALLEDPSVPKAGHNLKYDVQVMRRAGVTVRGLAVDTMLESFVLDSARRSHAVDTLAFDHLGVVMTTYGQVAGKGKAQIPFAEVAVSAAAAYCGADSAMVLALHERFAPQLHALPVVEALLRDVEMPLIDVLAEMEWTGIRIDAALFRKLGQALNEDLATLESKIGAVAGESLNINSPKQLAVVLFEKQGLPVLKKTKTGASTDADVLEQLAAMGHELPALILDYRELSKLRSTYVETLPTRVHAVTGRIHTSFNQTGAATGRLSSSDPNLQNIPVRSPRGEAIRRGFIPADGCRFVVADYSQIELRLMAHLSGDEAFTEAFRAGGDIHRQTAAVIFGTPLPEVTSEQRARAKTINFGTIYGQGPFALAKQLGISQDEAKAFITEYFSRFAGVRRFLDAQAELARSQGYVETILGRRRYIPEARDKNFNLRSFGERMAGNAPLQGSAADLIKVAMQRIHLRLGREHLATRMLLQVHDELVLEAPEAEVTRATALVKEEMEGAATLHVPLVADVGVGADWLSAKH